MMTNLRLSSWRDGVSIDFDILRWDTGERGIDGLLVVFSGTYRPGSSGNPDGRFMAMVISAALAWEAGHALVIDLQKLEYKGGDMLSYWKSFLSPARARGRGGFPVAYCASPSNVEAIRSLIEEESDEPVEESVFVGRASALTSIVDRLRRSMP